MHCCTSEWWNRDQKAIQKRCEGNFPLVLSKLGSSNCNCFECPPGIIKGPAHRSVASQSWPCLSLPLPRLLATWLPEQEAEGGRKGPRAPEVIPASLWSLKTPCLLPLRGLCFCCSPWCGCLTLSIRVMGLQTSSLWTSCWWLYPKSPTLFTCITLSPSCFACFKTHHNAWQHFWSADFSTAPPNPTLMPRWKLQELRDHFCLSVCCLPKPLTQNRC